MVDKFGLENKTGLQHFTRSVIGGRKHFLEGSFAWGCAAPKDARVIIVRLRLELRGVGYLRNRVLLDIYKSKNHKRKYDPHLKRVEEDVFNIFTDDIFVVIKGQILLEARFSLINQDLMFYLSQYERPNRSWTVLYMPVDGVYSCSCLQYESNSILCPHIFSVLKYQNVSVYPKSIILDRWTRGGGRLKVDHTAAKSGDDMSGRLLRYSALMAEAKKACHNLSYSAEGFDTWMVQLCGLVESSVNYRGSKKPRVADQEPDMDICNVLKDPVIARTKGLHGNNVAAAVNRNVGEGNKCRKCGIPGHNIRRCPLVLLETGLAGKSVKSGRSAQSGRSDKSTKADKSGNAKKSEKSAKAGNSAKFGKDGESGKAAKSMNGAKSRKAVKFGNSDQSGKADKSAGIRRTAYVHEQGACETVNPSKSESEAIEVNQCKVVDNMQRSSNSLEYVTKSVERIEYRDDVDMTDLNSQVGGTL
ncbi:hypothetical protein ACLB2K_076508 [Fragaria x ananassa]